MIMDCSTAILQYQRDQIHQVNSLTKRVLVHAQIACQALQLVIGERLFTEDRIKLTQRMSDLVDTLLLRHDQFLRVFGIQSRRLEECAYTRRRVQKVLVT
jgi:hypothetical protein